MRSVHVVSAVLLAMAIGVLCSAEPPVPMPTPTTALAAAATGPTSLPASMPANSILRQIPAGSFGYAMTNNSNVAITGVDKFLGSIGVAGDLKEEMPDGMMVFLKKQLKLGEGFNPDGGAAFVMLDPDKFGVDLSKWNHTTELWSKDDKGNVPPMLIIMPCTDIQKFFTEWHFTQDAKSHFWKRDDNSDTFWAMQKESYLFMAPSEKVLKAVQEETKTAADELTKDALAMLLRSEAGLHINGAVAVPMINKLIEKATQPAPAQETTPPGLDGDEGVGFDPDAQPYHPAPSYFDLVGPTIFKEILDPVAGVTAGLHWTQNGTVIESLVEYKPGSEVAKELAQTKESAVSLLDRLPDLGYVLAMGTQKGVGGIYDHMYGIKIPTATRQKIYKVLLDEAIKSAAHAKDLSPFPADKVKLMVNLGEKINEQITSARLVAGGAPEGKGLIGVAVALECKEPEKLKTDVAEAVKSINEAIKASATSRPDGENTSPPVLVKYRKDAMGESVDAIDIELVAPQMDENQRKIMRGFIGEDKIRILLAQADKNTLVVTCGGGKDFLDEAMRAAKEGGTIHKDKHVLEAMEFMPKNLNTLMALNSANLVQKIVDGAALAGSPIPFPLGLHTKTPLMAGTGNTATSEHSVLYVPTQLVQEFAGMIRLMIGYERNMFINGGNDSAPAQALPAGN